MTDADIIVIFLLLTMTSQSSSVSISTDSYPSLYKSFSSKQTECSQSEPDSSATASEPSNSSSSTSISVVLNFPKYEKSCSAFTARIEWDREAHVTGRPYELRNFDIPFKQLPAYLSQVGGLGIPPRKACLPPKVDPFHKRTTVDEIYHKRVTDANAYSITEQPKVNVCQEKPAAQVKSLPEIVRDILLVDNVDSDVDGEEADSNDSEDLSDVSWEAYQQRPRKDEVLRECKRSFFRARKELFKMRQYESYLEEKNRAPHEVESWEISSESSVVSVDSSEQLPIEQEIIQTPLKAPIDEYQSMEIVREEGKPRVVDHQLQHLERIREYLWEGYARKDREEEEAEAERAASPGPLDEEQIMKNLPEQDYLNRQKHQFREELAKHLEEIVESQKRVPKELPQTAIQFEKYTDELMRARRELVDEAILVDEHYSKAGLDVAIPEKDLPLRKFRAADFKSEESEEEKAEDDEPRATPAIPVVHTCMTRFEWSRWMGTCTKLEKLRLPKVKIPRLPIEVHRAEESPIKAFLRERSSEGKQAAQKVRSVQIKMAEEKRPKLRQWKLIDRVYEKPEQVRISDFAPYKPPLKPFPELAKDRFQLLQAQRRRKRQFRKNHMTWIDDLVDEICTKPRFISNENSA